MNPDSRITVSLYPAEICLWIILLVAVLALAYHKGNFDGQRQANTEITQSLHEAQFRANPIPEFRY